MNAETTYINRMNELAFDVTQEADGGFVAECLSESIFTQAATWEQLRNEVRDAVNGYYFDREKPERIRASPSPR